MLVQAAGSPTTEATSESLQQPSQSLAVVITGGSKGVGYALAREFLACGDRVLLCSRSEDRIVDAVASLQEEFPGVLRPSLTAMLLTRDKTQGSVGGSLHHVCRAHVMYDTYVGGSTGLAAQQKSHVVRYRDHSTAYVAQLLGPSLVQPHY